MKSKLLSNIECRREWVLIFDPGDEVMAGLKQFAGASNRLLTCASPSDPSSAWR